MGDVDVRVLIIRTSRGLANDWVPTSERGDAKAVGTTSTLPIPISIRSKE